MMKTRPQHSSANRLVASLLFGLIGLLVSVHANAEGANRIYATQVHIGSDGLAIQQPVISQTEILSTLTQAHRLLTKQGQEARTVVEKHDAGKNMVVAAIMPGGLLYLAYQQNKFKNAQTTLANIENELTDLDTDAVALYKPVYRPASQPILVARYP